MSASSETATRRNLGVGSASFLGLLATQFLGTVNDNLFRWLVALIGRHYVAPEYASQIMAAGLACLVLPYIVLAAPAGYLADRYSKRSVIVACKLAEIVIMLAGVGAIYVGSSTALFSVLAVMGAQSALFSPSKMGIMPEMLAREKLPTGNGLMGLVTVSAVVIGTGAAYTLFDENDPTGHSRLGLFAAALWGIALIGWCASLLIVRTREGNPALRFPANLLRETWHDLKTLGENRALLRVALGSAFFWSLGSLAQMNIDLFGTSWLNLKTHEIGPLMVTLSIGVGVGSVLAGIWSRGHVELGLVPLGAAGIALASMLLFTVPESAAGPQGESYVLTATLLVVLGLCSGLFTVPLDSYLQHRSPADSRGAILAASNFLSFSGMLLASGLYAILRAPVGDEGRPLFEPRTIFLLAGFLTLPVAIYALVLLPQATIRFVVWLASCTVYRVRVIGHDNLPETGGALLVPNHVSWIDGVLLLLTSSRPIRMMIYADYVELWWLRGLARLMGAIPIKPGQKKSVVEAIRRAREALKQGELVCIFPEGALTRSGQMQAFQPGFLALRKDTDAPVIPVYLDGLWGSIFSFHGGRFFWKWPRKWPYDVTVMFGQPLAKVEDADDARRAVQALGVEAVKQRKDRDLTLPRKMLRMCRRNLTRLKISDSTGMDLTGGTLLLRSLVARKLLLKHVLAADEKYVGVLLPPSTPGVVTNAAIMLAGRVAVNLNYTVSQGVMDSCIRQAGIRHVITSRRVMQKLEFELSAEVVYLEDLREKVTGVDKAIAAVQAYATPVAVLERLLGLTKIKPDDLLTVIFTSGSTGEPKGVMLSFQNIGSNVEAIDEIIQLKRDDVLLGLLPFFHSLGYTVTLCAVLALDLKGAYHFSPLDVRQVGELTKKSGGTILLTTPTFLRSYLRRCTPEEFSTLEVVVGGAEKLPSDLCEAFEKKYGVRPVEGYGTTELSPLVSVNIPKNRAGNTDMVVAKEGTVGRPIPGVAAKTVNPETGEDLGIDQPGLLWIKGPNVMQGYMNQPELTAKVLRDGWYNTGDIAVIDADGFIRITGRESRFSKIGGEMVPHLKIEEALQKVIGAGEEELKAVVTAVPDARKGERIVVMHLPLEKSPETITKELAAEGLPNLWIPSPDSFCQVDEIPVLGTGKLDLKALKNLALEKFAKEPSPSTSS
jgi:acyl-[acyl-carrier-protein]-phospholipid O-acyltransferase/long-chain-fatty-acid--[acyl-carrier-protein] ligase